MRDVNGKAWNGFGVRASEAGIDNQSMRKISGGEYCYGAIVARMKKGEH